MKLVKDNNDLWYATEERILSDFVQSEVFQKSMDEKVKLALFISYETPRGLGSTFLSGKEFEKLYDVYKMKKAGLLACAAQRSGDGDEY